jgi:hypothetical protein
MMTLKLGLNRGIQMKLKSIVVAAVITALLPFASFASGAEKEVVKMTSESYYNPFKIAYTKHEQGRHAEAFPELLKYATYGEKIAQYLVGTYMVTGTGTEQNIIEGLIWMGVALEQQDPIWEKSYAKIYNQLSAEQKKELDALIAERKALYGADSQNMACRFESIKTGTNIKAHRCYKIRDAMLYVRVIKYPAATLQ